MQTRPLIALTDKSYQQDAEAILRSCVHCGFCNATCPTYLLLGDECDGPRGRIYLIKQVLEGAGENRKTQQHLDRCLTCLACESVCPSGVKYGRLLTIGRDVVEQQAGRAVTESFKRRLLCAVLPYRRRFAILLGCARILTPFLPAPLRRKITRVPSAKRPSPPSKHQRRVLMPRGCVQAILTPGINSAAERVLDKLRISVVSEPADGCCGALSHHLSAHDGGLGFMRRNIDAWIPYLDDGVEALVMTASGCGLMVKDYGEIFKHDVLYSAKAKRISAAAVDIAELLAAEDLSCLMVPDTKIKLAVQSPCTLQHGHHLNGVVETLLQNLGFELTSVSDRHLCCGSAGAYSLLQPDISGQLLKNKVNALEMGRPDVIVTANTGCLIHLQSAARIPVQHWIELLDEVLPD